MALPLQSEATVPFRQLHCTLPEGSHRPAKSSSGELHLLSRCREVKSDSEESEPEQDVAESLDGWRVAGHFMKVKQ